MRSNRLMTTVTLATLGLFAAGADACGEPVSEEATIGITGTILRADGTPAADQEVRLWKADLNLFESDVFTGFALETGSPFRTVRTGEDGSWRMEMTGAEANTSGMNFAAYFVASTELEEGGAIATRPHTFSNQELDWSIGEMQFWETGSVEQAGDAIEVRWEEAPTAPRGGAYTVSIADRWVAPYEGSEATIPIEAVGEAPRELTLQLVASGDEFRYRTAPRPFTIEPARAPIDYAQPGANNRAAEDCAGGNVFDINDGAVVGGDQEVENFDATEGDDEQVCVTITLPEPRALGSIVVANAAVSNHDSASIVVERRAEEAGEWIEVARLGAREGTSACTTASSIWGARRPPRSA